MRHGPVAALLVGILAAGCGHAVAPVSAEGAWGGEHIALHVTPVGATVEFDCASGTVDGPLRPDASGRFSTRGGYLRGRGGPARENDPGERHPARYEGRIRGREMTLTVVLTDLDREVGTFRLRRGATPRLFRCL